MLISDDIRIFKIFSRRIYIAIVTNSFVFWIYATTRVFYVVVHTMLSLFHSATGHGRRLESLDPFLFLPDEVVSSSLATASGRPVRVPEMPLFRI
jgi:hypothetical protein